MKPITNRQREVLALLAASTKNGLQLLAVELTKQLGLRSVNGAEQHIDLLARKGCLVRSDGSKARALAITEHGWAEAGYVRCQCGSWKKEGTL